MFPPAVTPTPSASPSGKRATKLSRHMGQYLRISTAEEPTLLHRPSTLPFSMQKDSTNPPFSTIIDEAHRTAYAEHVLFLSRLAAPRPTPLEIITTHESEECVRPPDTSVHVDAANKTVHASPCTTALREIALATRRRLFPAPAPEPAFALPFSFKEGRTCYGSSDYLLSSSSKDEMRGLVGARELGMEVENGESKEREKRARRRWKEEASWEDVGCFPMCTEKHRSCRGWWRRRVEGRFGVGD